jgi:hypothetical protein
MSVAVCGSPPLPFLAAPLRFLGPTLPSNRLPRDRSIIRDEQRPSRLIDLSLAESVPSRVVPPLPFWAAPLRFLGPTLPRNRLPRDRSIIRDEQRPSRPIDLSLAESLLKPIIVPTACVV